MEINQLQKEFEKLLAQKRQVINLSMADYSFFPSLLNQKKISKTFSDILEYPYYQPISKGDPEARASIAKWYKQKGLEMSPDNIILTSGSSESYLYLFKIFSENNGEILFPTPSYPLFEEIAKLINLKLKHYRLDPQEAWQPDLEYLQKKINKNTRALVLISPNNPTGTVINKKNFLRILEIAQKHKLAIICDEVFSEFIFNDESPPVLDFIKANNSRQLIFTLNGLSKSLALPGLKLSWITVHGPKKDTSKYVQRLEFLADIFLTTNQLSQLLASNILKYSKKWLKKFQKTVEKNRDITVEILSKCRGLEFAYPQGGFYLFPALVLSEQTGKKKAITELTDEQFALKLLKEKQIYVQPGYYYDYPDGCHFVICFLQSPKTLKKGLKKMVSFIEGLN